MDSAVALTSDADYDGAGEFVKRGIGTLTLTGANTRTGATTVEGGTLVGEVNSALMGDIGVASGAAVGVTLCGLQAPEAVAAALTAAAAAAGVVLRIECGCDGKVDVLVGDH